MQEVVENLPFQLFIPTFDKYFPDIKKVFYKEFIDNGIENTYEEVKKNEPKGRKKRKRPKF